MYILKTKNIYYLFLSLIKKYDVINACYQKAQHYINLASNSLSVFDDCEEKNPENCGQWMVIKNDADTTWSINAKLECLGAFKYTCRQVTYRRFL